MLDFSSAIIGSRSKKPCGLVLDSVLHFSLRELPRDTVKHVD